jgi:hypothetical protein
VEREQAPLKVMAWGGIGHNFKSQLIFVHEELKIDHAVYIEMLGLFKQQAKVNHPHRIGTNPDGTWRRRFTFQQDGAPAHKHGLTQEYCRTHFPDFISYVQWPPASPDINPIENVWAILKERACAEPHADVESLKRALEREWAALSQREINRIIDAWPGRLAAMIRARGRRFE